MNPNDEQKRLQPEDVCEGEWADWYRLTPSQRWQESLKLWEVYLSLGGSLDSEPDTQSPFFDADEWRASLVDGRSSRVPLRADVLRRGGV